MMSMLYDALNYMQIFVFASGNVENTISGCQPPGNNSFYTYMYIYVGMYVFK